jgi:hypothetical protein
LMTIVLAEDGVMGSVRLDRYSASLVVVIA